MTLIELLRMMNRTRNRRLDQFLFSFRFNRSLVACTLAAALCLRPLYCARAEDHFDYKYENYMEDNRRIHIENHSVLLESQLLPWLNVKGDLAYDAVSGATPTGNTPNSSYSINNGGPLTADIHDIRRAGSIGADLKYGISTFSPSFSYSKESDYKSRGIAGTYAVDLNEKNTTLKLGVSHDFDEVLYNNRMQGDYGQLAGQKAAKESTEFLVGISQLLDPATVFTANVSLGQDRGQLTDTYRGIIFDSQSAGLFQEIRPRHRDKEVAYLSLTHFFKKLNGSIEGSYRFYHDTFGVYGNTVALAWYQKLGSHVVLSPSFRFYTQTAATFYYPSVPGNVVSPDLASVDIPTLNSIPGFNVDRYAPSYYSADYRLSEFNSFSYGLSLSYKICAHATFDASYERYEMHGSDGVTPGYEYPSAHIVTFGMKFFF